MKKLLFWIVLIVGTVALLGSCAKKDETAAAAAAIPAEGTGTTASGIITGSTLTGTFHTSHLGEEPSGGCVDNSTSLYTYHSFPSETKSLKKKFIVTGTSTYTVNLIGYSDTACSTMTSYFNLMYTDFTIGSELSSLTAGSAPAKPTTGVKLSRVLSKMALMANTTATIASHLSNYESSVDSGVELLVDVENPTTQYGIAATATVSGSSYLYTYDGSTADNVTDWPTSGTDIWWK